MSTLFFLQVNFSSTVAVHNAAKTTLTVRTFTKAVLPLRERENKQLVGHFIFFTNHSFCTYPSISVASSVWLQRRNLVGWIVPALAVPNGTACWAVPQALALSSLPYFVEWPIQAQKMLSPGDSCLPRSLKSRQWLWRANITLVLCLQWVTFWTVLNFMAVR